MFEQYEIELLIDAIQNRSQGCESDETEDLYNDLLKKLKGISK